MVALADIVFNIIVIVSMFAADVGWYSLTEPFEWLQTLSLQNLFKKNIFLFCL